MRTFSRALPLFADGNLSGALIQEKRGNSLRGAQATHEARQACELVCFANDVPGFIGTTPVSLS
jgi:hypothetical protein